MSAASPLALTSKQSGDASGRFTVWQPIPPLLFQTSTTIQSAVIFIVHTVMKALVTCCSEYSAVKRHTDNLYTLEQWI